MTALPPDPPQPVEGEPESSGDFPESSQDIFPQPPGIPLEPAPATPRPLRVIVLWAILGVIVVVTVLLQTGTARTRATGPAIDGSDTAENFRLTLLSQYVVGVNALMHADPSFSPSRGTGFPGGGTSEGGGGTSGGGGGGTSGGGGDFATRMMAQLDSIASTPGARLRVACVAGELQGSYEALRRLDLLLFEKALPEALQQDVEDLRVVYLSHGRSLENDRRRALIARHGWYAKLALSQGEPADDPLRQEALAPAHRLVIAAISFGLLALVVCIVGTVLLIVAIGLLITRRLRPRFTPVRQNPPHADVWYLESFVLFLVGMIGLQLLALVLYLATDLDARYVVMLPLMLAPLWPMVRGASFGRLRRELGWHRGAGVIREMGSGVVGYMAGLPIVAVAVILSGLLAQLEGASPTHPIVEELASAGPVEIILLYVLACVWAPLFEETMFRGALYNHLRYGMGAVMAGLVTGLVFAAIHPQGWVAVPALTSLAFVFALLREWRGSLIAPMTAHALNNFVAVTLVMLVFRGA